MAHSYPVEFPLAEITNVVNIARSGEVKSRLPEFAQDLWWVQGYAQSAVIGNPAVLDSQDVESDPVVVLEKIAKDYESGALTAQGVLDWRVVLLWAIGEIQKLIEDYLQQS